MRIPLNNGNGETPLSGPEARIRALGKDIAAARRGDWEARRRVERSLMPLLVTLAKKRASETAEVNKLIDAGKEGIAAAIRKFTAGTPADRFQIFALPYIEERMDHPGRRSFLSRLFGGG